MRSMVTLVGVALLLVVGLVAPAVAQEDEEEQEATPVPTTMPMASPPALVASPSPVPTVTGPSYAGPEPPGVTAGVYANALMDSTVFPVGTCPNGLSGGANDEEGFNLVVKGRCSGDSDVADVAVQGRGITIGDGDVALDVRLAFGATRGEVELYVRNKDRKLLGASINPAAGEARLFRLVQGERTILASRSDIAQFVSETDWNRLAIRVRGSEAWLLLNDQPMLYASDVPAEPGGIGIRALRLGGNPDDEDEMTAVFRDLTLSTVEGAAPTRAPTFPAP